MSICDRLKTLEREQGAIKDDVRIYSDGSVKIKTLTENGDIGWYILAPPIAGSKIYFMSYFGAAEFLKISDMREAITIRDGIFESVAENRFYRKISDDLKNR